MPEAIVASLEHTLEQLFPADLVHQNPPTAVAHANNIDPWVKWYFKRAIAENLHYEHQLYGPDNVYLHSCFPIHRRFAVIPQALLRRAIATNARVNELNISTGSSGGSHWGRESKGKGNLSEAGGKVYPDFMMVKVIPTPITQPRKHYVVCVVEIKLWEEGEEVNRKDQVSAESQMARYMNTLIKHPYRVPELKGYLIAGTKYLEYQIVGDTVEYDPGQYKDICAPGDPLTEMLCTIAVQEWNRASVDVAVTPPADPAAGGQLEEWLNAAGL